MKLSTLTHGEPWMTPEEQDLNRGIIHGITEFLTAGGAEENAFVALRVNDIATTWLLVRRLELILTPAEGETPPCPTPAQADAIGKCRERLRRAMKELEDSCPRTDPPARQNFVDHMHQIIKKVRATGLVEDGPFPIGSTEYPKTDDIAPESAGGPIPAGKVPGTQPRNASENAESKPQDQTPQPAPKAEIRETGNPPAAAPDTKNHGHHPGTAAENTEEKNQDQPTPPTPNSENRESTGPEAAPAATAHTRPRPPKYYGSTGKKETFTVWMPPETGPPDSGPTRSPRE